jgi:hypothetical protein
MTTCLSVCLLIRLSLSACLTASLPPCLPACLPTCLPTCLPPCLPACLPACRPACLPAYLPTYLPAYLPVCLPACLPACLLVLLALLLLIYLRNYSPLNMFSLSSLVLLYSSYLPLTTSFHLHFSPLPFHSIPFTPLIQSAIVSPTGTTVSSSSPPLLSVADLKKQQLGMFMHAYTCVRTYKQDFS